jgi:UDP-N-acetylmuramoyl-L-alanyl-D-glutamate--2,6-diaminopimelate ligase
LLAAGLEAPRLTKGPHGGEPARAERDWDDPEVIDVTLNSREVTPGALFACTTGLRLDGHDYAADAIGRGAVALLCERPLDVAVVQVVVPSVREVLGPVSAAFWGQPSLAVRVVGVTGTNGKTTTCALLASIFEAHGWRAGVVGTLTGERTTPEAPQLQRRLATLRDEGAAAVAIEVSSHALDQHRVGGTRFAAAVFTNLSQDHLDYHGTMEAYFAAKARLFTGGQAEVAVINTADPWGARLAAQLPAAGPRVVTYSPEEATGIITSAESTSFSWRGLRVGLRMGGTFNVANAVAAAVTAEALGIGVGTVCEGLASAAPVRGRFETVDAGQPFSVLVDFAHTPAALGAALRAARELAETPAATAAGHRARVLLVFGAGGERDRGKRPQLGRVASEMADLAVLTSDNPRSEEPLAIIGEVASGAHGAGLVVEPDRAVAIERAISEAGPGDVVLIAGKGHEAGQDFGSHVDPFDDAQAARLALERLYGARRVERSL